MNEPVSDHDVLIRLDVKMDSVLHWQEEHMARSHEVHKQQQRDLDNLKEWKYREAGALAVLVFVLQFVGEWVMQAVGVGKK
mgnify:FL=1